MKVIKIGRSQGCEIVINDPAVSRMHATITITDENLFQVRDEQSANGTFVNGNRITDTVILRENDIVKVGNTVIPWKNYIEFTPSRPMNTHPASPIIDIPTVVEKKKKISVAWWLTLVIILGLSALILYFFYKSQQDDLKLSATWVCPANCGTLREIVFEKGIDQSGKFFFFKPSSTDSVPGTWSIDPEQELVTLSPGLDSGIDSTNRSGSEPIKKVYKYSMKKDKLTLRIWDSGQYAGDEINLVKRRK